MPLLSNDLLVLWLLVVFIGVVVGLVELIFWWYKDQPHVEAAVFEHAVGNLERGLAIVVSHSLDEFGVLRAFMNNVIVSFDMDQRLVVHQKVSELHILQVQSGDGVSLVKQKAVLVLVDVLLGRLVEGEGVQVKEHMSALEVEHVAVINLEIVELLGVVVRVLVPNGLCSS